MENSTIGNKKNLVIVSGIVFGTLLIIGLSFIFYRTLNRSHRSAVYYQVRNQFTISDLKQQTGISDFYFPPCSYEQRENGQCTNTDPVDPNILELLNPQPGVYTLRWKEDITGNINKSGQDRYELVFNEKIAHIYGLGYMGGSGGVQVDDFLDLNFAEGHEVVGSISHGDSGGEWWNGDMISARTPIFVIPSKNLIVLYIQDEIKSARLARSDTSTTIVLNKSADYGQFNAGKLVIIKGNTLAESYSQYYSFLQSEGFTIKKPHWRAFGLNWEIWGEVGVYPRMDVITKAIAQYESNNLQLDTLTLGTGYWNYDHGYRGDPPFFQTNTSCTSLSPQTNCPPDCRHDCGAASMEIMELNPDFMIWDKNKAKEYGVDEDMNGDGQYDLKDFIDVQLAKKPPTYTILGMRHNSRAEYAGELAAKLGWGQNDTYIDEKTYYGENPLSSVMRILNITSAPLMNTLISKYHDTYGNFKGLKEDEMHFVNQDYARSKAIYDITHPNHVGITPVPTAIAPTLVPPVGKNIPNSLFSHVFAPWIANTNNDIVMMASNNNFSMASDTQETQNWIPFSFRQGDIDGYGKDMYHEKFPLDTMLVHAISGYPHSSLLGGWTFAYYNGSEWKLPGSNGYDAPGVVCSIVKVDETNLNKVNREAKRYLRSFQWATFSPVVWQSCGFWHLYQDGKGGVYNDEIADFFPDLDIDVNLMKSYRDSFVFFNNLRMRLHQYIYDQAQEWYQTGVPTLMQPLFINEDWKSDPEVHKLYRSCPPGEASAPQYDCYPSQEPNNTIVQDEYLFGKALLVRPIMSDADNPLKVYLPAGKWRSFLKPMSLIDSPGGEDGYINFTPDNKINYYPAFLREGQILLIGTMGNPEDLQAYVFLESKIQSEIYRMHDRSSDPAVNSYTRIQAIKDNNSVILKNLDNGAQVAMVPDAYGKGFMVADLDMLLPDPTETPIPSLTPTKTTAPTKTPTPFKTPTPQLTKTPTPALTSAPVPFPIPTCPPMNCASWTTMNINNCTLSAWNEEPRPDYCTTVNYQVPLSNNNPSASQMRFININPLLYCNTISESATGWSAWEPYTSWRNQWRLAFGNGEKKVCVQYKNACGNVSPICGGMVEKR